MSPLPGQLVDHGGLREGDTRGGPWIGDDGEAVDIFRLHGPRERWQTRLRPCTGFPRNIATRTRSAGQWAREAPLPKPNARRRQPAPPDEWQASVMVGRPPMPAGTSRLRRRPSGGGLSGNWRRRGSSPASTGGAALVRYCQRLGGLAGDTRGHAGALRLKLLKGARGHFVRNPLWFMKQGCGADLGGVGLTTMPVTPHAARLRAGIAHERPREEGESPALIAIEEYRRKLQG